MNNYVFARFAIAFFLLAGLALGGFDQSGGSGGMNLSMTDFRALGLESNTLSSVADSGAPEATAIDPGIDVAAYTNQAPVSMDLKQVFPSDIAGKPPMYMYYNGNYMAWNHFAATFPGSQPGLWIERALGWSIYATMPLGGWARELLYMPAASPVTMYEVYPSGYVMSYDLGVAQSGYNYIWYYADTPGRHYSLFTAGGSRSNPVVVDVYTLNPSRPQPPTPKEQCEQKPYCHWVNGQCLCTMPPISEKELCLQKPYCNWVNGHCYCTMPDPEKSACEQNPLCDWVDGHCYCRGDIDPEKESCEQNPQCSWSNGQCLCRGLNPPEPMPGPVPNPNPEPEPFNPAPNPVAECQSNPGCQWSNGGCRCTGFNPGGDSGTIDPDPGGDFALGLAGNSDAS
jgi:hypothetical protein